MSIYDEIYETAFKDELEKIAEDPKVDWGDFGLYGVLPSMAQLVVPIPGTGIVAQGLGADALRKKHGIKREGVEGFARGTGRFYLDSLLPTAGGAAAGGVIGAGAGAILGAGLGGLARRPGWGAAMGALAGPLPGALGGLIVGAKSGLQSHIRREAKRQDERRKLEEEYD